MDNLVDFNQAKLLKMGGKEPPTGNWLADLEPGTVIICRKKPMGGYPLDAGCQEFVVVRHEGTVTLLYRDLNPPPVLDWVETKIFSETVTLVHKGKYKKNVDI